MIMGVIYADTHVNVYLVKMSDGRTGLLHCFASDNTDLYVLFQYANWLIGLYFIIEANDLL